MKYKIAITVGDYSGDCHDKKDIFLFQSNCSSSALYSAYRRGVKIVDVDLSRDVCANYGGSTIMGAYYTKLLSHKLIDKTFNCYGDEDDRIFIYPEEFVKIYLGIVKLGFPDFSFEEIMPDTINIGGYGLYF